MIGAALAGGERDPPVRREFGLLGRLFTEGHSAGGVDEEQVLAGRDEASDERGSKCREEDDVT
jgi:hypothetical protein